MAIPSTEEDVDKQLRNLAVTDWKKFKEVTGLDLELFFICTQRKNGKSFRQIAYKMNIPFTTIRNRCKKCKD